MSTKILLVDSNPLSAQHLRINKEFKGINTAIDTSRFKSSFDIQYSNATTIESLRRSLLDSDPEILHFSAHGSSTEIFLEDEDGALDGVTHTSLVGLIKIFRNTKCVILNVCDSYTLGEKLSEFVPYVVCVKGKVLDNHAINFSKGFYDAIARGETVNESFEFGLNSINLHMGKDEIELNRSLHRKKASYTYNIIENKTIIKKSQGANVLYVVLSVVILYLLLNTVF